MAPTVAYAQIYAWRDAAGNLVLSDKPKDPSAKTYAVATARPTSAAATSFAGKADGYRTTKAIARVTRYDDAIADHASKNALNPDFVTSRDPGGVRLQPASGLAEGRDGPDAADAADRGRVRRARRLQPDGEHPRRASRISRACWFATTTTNRWHWRPTMRVPALSKNSAAAFRPTAKHATTSQRSGPLRRTSATRPVTRVFKTVEIVDGREVVHYTNKPASGGVVVKGTDR